MKTFAYITVDSNDGDYVNNMEEFKTLEDAKLFKEYANKFGKFCKELRSEDENIESINDYKDKFLKNNKEYKKFENVDFPTNYDGFGHTLVRVKLFQAVK